MNLSFDTLLNEKPMEQLCFAGTASQVNLPPLSRPAAMRTGLSVSEIGTCVDNDLETALISGDGPQERGQGKNYFEDSDDEEDLPEVEHRYLEGLKASLEGRGPS